MVTSPYKYPYSLSPNFPSQTSNISILFKLHYRLQSNFSIYFQTIPMETTKLVFVSIVVAVLVLSISGVAEQESSTENYSPAEDYHKDDVDDSITMAEGRLLLQKKRSRRATCNKFPGICRVVPRGAQGLSVARRNV
ncbi:hypothetical protein GQ457_13G002040 [Hibiscus cannabinus]